MSRENVSPDGVTNSATATVMRAPSWTRRSPRRWNGTEVDQSRCAALGSGAGRADELAEQRMRPIGTRPELGMALRAHPERMAGELDELDQPLVGRRARTPQTGGLQTG